MRIEDFIIMVFCLIDDAMQKIIGNTSLRKRGLQPSLNDSEVITMELLGEYLQIDTDKGIWQYFSQHWHHFFPGLNSRSNFSKHAANLWQIKQMIQAHLVKQFDNHPVHIHIIDGFPIPTANIKRSRKSIFLKIMLEHMAIVPARTNIILVLKEWCLSINSDSSLILLPQQQTLMKDNQCAN